MSTKAPVLDEKGKPLPGLYKQETRSGVSYIVRFMFGGTEHSKKLISPMTRESIEIEADAITMWQDYRQRIAKKEWPFDSAKTLDAWIAEYLKFHKPPRNSAGTLKDKTFRLGYWRKWMRDKYPRVVHLGELDREHFEAYQTRGVSPVTVNLDFRYLKHALNFAVEREWLDRSPIERLKRLPEPVEPKKTLSVDTVSKVAKHLPLVPKAAWWFCAETGVRPGEMFALTWGQLDMKERRAVIKQRKTNKLKTVYFSAQTKKLLEKIPPAKEGHVFYSKKGAPFNRLSWRDTVYRAAHDAKLIGWDSKRLLWGTPPNPYSLRHTATSAMLENEDVATVRDAVGHSSIAVTNIYAHSSPERIKAAFERLHKRKK
jgi:integrase